MQLLYSNRTEVRNNICLDEASAGLHVSDCHNLTVSDNDCDRAADRGILARYGRHQHVRLQLLRADGVRALVVLAVHRKRLS